MPRNLQCCITPGESMKKISILIATASLALTARAEPAALYAIAYVPPPAYASAAATDFQTASIGSTTFAVRTSYNATAVHAGPIPPAAAAGSAPAPADSTLMLAGIGALGFIARRRLA